uniref:Glycosyl transferase family 28 C-terminal domain-containing protein n=1 Tax=viral metagenome TaxID=1070528 RepID=A0A6C0CXI8_9ZZZZ
MTKRIAIYNSIPCHYEMFGYIIYYCYVNKFTIEIFTENFFDMHWLSFYKNVFQNYNITYKNHGEFENSETRNTFDLIFLTTDDDAGFKYEWMNNKVICIVHYYICRRIDYYHCIGVRPFKKNQIKWGLPCFPVFDKSNKQYDPEVIHVSIIGGGNLDTNLYNINIINRLKSNKKIMIHVITRLATQKMVDILKKKNDTINITLYQHMNTENMFSLLQSSNYILTDATINNDHISGYSMTGSVPLAFSSLSRLIISSRNNKMYNFNSALEFDLNTNEYIILDDIKEEVIDLMIQERGTLIEMFHNHLDEIIKINETMNHDDLYHYLLKNRNIL